MKFCPNCGKPLPDDAVACSCSEPGSYNSASDPAHIQKYSLLNLTNYQETFREASKSFSDAISGKTNVWRRILSILSKPKTEWLVIDSECTSVNQLYGGYILILSLIPSLAILIRKSIISGVFPDGLAGFFYQLILNSIVAFGLTKLVELMAPSFYTEQDYRKSLQLVAYSLTPFWVAGILILFFGDKLLFMFLGWAYSGYLLRLGIPVLKKTREDKVTGYLSLTIICMIFGTFLVMGVLKLIY
jgi:hypothetical protein